MAKKIYADYKKPYINLGYVQENEHLEVYFNIAEYIGYTIDIIHQRPGDTIPVPVTETRIEGNYIVWTVTTADTDYAGKGKLYLQYTLNDVVDKSVIFTTEIMPGVAPSEAPTDTLRNWYNDIIRAADEAKAAAGQAGTEADNAESYANAIEDLTVSAESLGSDESASVTKTKSGDHWHLEFGIPRGEKPEYGVDYYTEDDKSEIIDAVTDDATNAYNAAVREAQDNLDEYLENKEQEFKDDLDEASEKAIDDYNKYADTLFNTKFDEAYVKDGYLYFRANGLELTPDGIGPFAGGGGGGSGGGTDNDAVVTFTNTTGWRNTSLSEGSECVLSVTWSSIEHEAPTGPGTLRVYANGVLKETRSVQQGSVSIDVTDYLISGSNTIRLVISDSYDNSRAINFSINIVAVYIESSFNDGVAYTGAISFPYVPTGSIAKTVYFVLDGSTLDTRVITDSGRRYTYEIPKQSHGHHIFEVYFTALLDGQTMSSNILYYDIICVDEGDNTPIITSDFNSTKISQYDSLVVPYYVYTPDSLESPVTISINGDVVSSQTVGRDLQTYSYRVSSSDNIALVIQSGETTREFDVEVEGSSADIQPVTTDLELYLAATGRNNNEADPSKWDFESISASLTGFNFISDGWQLDEDKNTVLRVSGDARVDIPLKMFASDFARTGKTIEIEFATRDVMDYDTTIISCYNGGSGIQYTAQMASIVSTETGISTQYKENEHIRVTFVVEKDTENKLIYSYINGVMSGVIQYTNGGSFTQYPPVDITIGSDKCTVDIYAIRVYDNDLTRYEVLNNWIADTQNASDMITRYRRNDIYNEYGKIVISKLPQDLPYMVVKPDDGAHMPQYKGDKQPVSGYYVDPVDSSKSFSFESAEFNVQGTSSQYYPRKNYKVKFKKGFIMTESGETVSKYAMNDNAIPTNTFTFKADFASSEGANNVELVRLYNDTCTYKTVYQQEDSRIRQGIDGFPFVLFLDNGTSVDFVGKLNFNNDKGTEEVYGFQDGDESWEFKNNTSNRTLFKSADFTSTKINEDGETVYAWLDDFEGRYPDGSEDATNLAKVCAWVVSTDQSAATNAVITPVTYAGVTYTTDSAAYRLAKFKAEFADWFELEAMTYFYVFTEAFLMVDNRAKNMFITKMGDSKWFMLPYDFDTAIGIKC